MRIVFMGTPEFAVPTLQALAQSDHLIELVVTQPDRPAGRSGKPRPSAVKTRAEKLGLELFQPESIKSEAVLEKLQSCEADVFIVIAYGKILPTSVLNIPRLGCVNIHASLLPAYRGAAPINWAIIEGETETGVTIMEMDEGMDTGPIIEQKKVPILEDDDAVSLGSILSTEGAQLLIKVLDEIEENNRIDSRPKNDKDATYAPLLKKEDGRLNWDQSTEALICRVRGLVPWPGAHTSCQRGMFKIIRVEPAWESLHPDIEKIVGTKPGTVARLAKGYGPVVRTSDGFVLITEGQVQGKRSMSGTDLVNGGMLLKNEVLGQ
ncbi:MAG: methionyl-tRNA formyltransferase [Candidatus Sumerlaeota bacterium]